MPRVHRYFKELRLRQLRAIVELSRRGTFAAVARSLDLSVASVWQQIRAMEREFGVELVRVVGRVVQLTAEGRLLVERATTVVEGFDGLRELFRDEAAATSRRIVLAVTPSLMLHELRGPLAAYRRAWPGVEMDILEGTSAESLHRLETSAADVAIAGHVQPQSPDTVTSWPLLDYPFVIVAPPGNPLLSTKRLTPAAIVKHPLVLTREGSFSLQRVRAVLEAAGLWGSVTASLTAGGADLLGEYVRLGLGVTVASVSPQLLGIQPRGCGAFAGLHYRDVTQLFGVESIACFTRKARFERPHVRAFRETILTHFGTVVRALGCLIAVVFLAPDVFGQDAASAERSAFNAPTGPSRMAADSPITFPVSGPLPPRHLPDVAQPALPTEEGVYVFESLPLIHPAGDTPLSKYPGRSPDQVTAIGRTMPAGTFTAPINDWRGLRQTRRVLAEGGTLTIVAIGDSIMNDTMRSGWISQLRARHPLTTIRGFVCVRGGGGCHFFGQNGRLARYVEPLQPDLVIIGGISRGDLTLADGTIERAGIAPIREAVGQLRAALPKTEILLMTGAFGAADPRSDEELAAASHSATAPEGRELRCLAAEEGCGFLDMTTAWAEYIRSSGRHPHVFYRDRVHANEHGEQILAKILLAYFSSP